MTMFGFVLGILSSFLIAGLAKMTDVDQVFLFVTVTYLIVIQHYVAYIFKKQEIYG